MWFLWLRNILLMIIWTVTIIISIHLFLFHFNNIINLNWWNERKENSPESFRGNLKDIFYSYCPPSLGLSGGCCICLSNSQGHRWNLRSSYTPQSSQSKTPKKCELHDPKIQTWMYITLIWLGIILIWITRRH